MIKFISNITNSGTISLATKMMRKVNGAWVDVPTTGGAFSFASQDDILFVKVYIHGLSIGQKIGHLAMQLPYKDLTSICSFRLFSAEISSLDSTPVELLNSLSSQATDQVVAKSDEGKGKTINFDLTSLAIAHGASNQTFIFALENDSTEMFTLYDPQSVGAAGLAICQAVVTDPSGLDPLIKYDNFSAGDYDKSYIAINSGKSTHLFNFFVTPGQKMPLSLSLCQSRDRHFANPLFQHFFAASFQYSLASEGDGYILEDYTGRRVFYRYLNRAQNSDFAYSDYGITHEESGGTLYYSDADCSYFYLLSTGAFSGNEVHFYDRTGAEIIFLLYGGKTQIQEIKDVENHITNFTWNPIPSNPIKVSSISNDLGESVLITYNDSNLLSKFEFPKEKRAVSVSYPTSTTVRLIFEDVTTHTTLAQTLITLAEERIVKITDEVTGRNVSFTRDLREPVKNVTTKNQSGDTENSVGYLFRSGYTKVTDAWGKSSFVYFDKYNRVRTIIDSRGQASTLNYGELEDGAPKGALGQSKPLPIIRNYLENHSFENDDLFSSGSLAWAKSGSGSAKAIVGGLRGGKCLQIKNAAGQRVSVTQSIVSPQVISYSAKGFYRFNASTSGVDASVKLTISYTRLESVIVSGSASDGTLVREMREVSHSIEKKRNLAFASQWASFYTDPYEIPTASHDIHIVLSIDVVGGPSEILFDDFQLGSSSYISANNLIENGHLELNEGKMPRGWSFTNLVAADGLFPILASDELFSILGGKAMRFTALPSVARDGDQFSIRKMSKIIQVSTLVGEEFVFSIFAKAFATTNDVFRAYLRFVYVGYPEKRFDFDFEKGLSTWQMLERSVVASHALSAIEVGVEYNGSEEADFDCFQLLRDSFGEHYQYDDRGNITQAADSSGANLKIQYNNADRPTEVLTPDGNFFRYAYTNGKLASIKDLNGNEFSFSYDVAGNVSGTVLKNAAGETITHSTSFDTAGNLISSVDEHGNSSHASYDDLSRLTAETAPGGVFTKEYSYDIYSNLKSVQALCDGTLLKNQMTYRAPDQALTGVEETNGARYNFQYDSAGRVASISVNGEIINAFTYGLTKNGINSGLITEKRYGATGDLFDFDYDDDERLSAISLNGSATASFTYDENDRIASSTDEVHHRTKIYGYDLKGRLAKTISPDAIIAESYDNLGGLQKKTYQINGIHRSVDFTQIYEANEYTREGFFNRLSSAYSEEMIRASDTGAGDFGAKALTKTVDVVIDSSCAMPAFSFQDRFDLLWYDLGSFNTSRTDGYIGRSPFSLFEWRTAFYWFKCFGLWVKPSGQFGDQENFLTFEKFQSTSDNSILSHLYVDGSGRVCYRSKNSSTPAVIGGTLTLGAWNFVYFRIEGNLISGVKKALISVNGSTLTSATIEEDATDINRIVVAYQETVTAGAGSGSGSAGTGGSSTLKMPFEIALLTAGFDFFTEEECRGIYREGLKYFVSPQPVSRSSGIAYYNQAAYQGFDVISLNGSLESTDGIQPAEVTESDSTYQLAKARIFKFDSQTGRHVYGSYGADSNLVPGQKPCLSYDLPLGSVGSLSIRFKLDGAVAHERCLFAFQGQTGLLLGFFINGAHLRLAEHGTNVSLGDISANVWHTLSVTYDAENISVFVDNSSRTLTPSVNLTGARLYVGISSKNGTDYLEGLMEMLAFASFRAGWTRMSEIAAKSAPILCRNSLDSLGRLAQEKIVVYDHQFITNFVYDKLRVSQETLPDGSILNYTYNAQGDVAAIVDNAARRKSYVYYPNGRLKSETNETGLTTTYSYDANGNILASEKKNQNNAVLSSLRYVYDQTVKDRLVQVINNSTGAVLRSFAYAGAYKGNPSSMTINGTSQNLVWSGRRLTGIGSAIHYAYDENGIRFEKTVGAVSETYVLDGSNVVSLTRQASGATTRLDFAYDEKGFVRSLTTGGNECFYLRDVTGNILGLINSDGNYVVKYSYDAWGVPQKTILIPCVAASENPFLYKGYFYDDETGFYYLKSRFYDPSLGRFISADSIAEISEDSLEKVNLFAYCQNNPIEGYDPDGRSDSTNVWKALGVIGVCVLIMGVTIATSGSALGMVGIGIFTGVASGFLSSAGSQFLKTGTVDWLKVAVDAAVGGAIGALSALEVGAFVATVRGASTSCVSSMISDWVSDRPIDLTTAAISGLVGGFVGFIGSTRKKIDYQPLKEAVQARINRFSQSSEPWAKGLLVINQNLLKRLDKFALQMSLQERLCGDLISALSSGVKSAITTAYVEEN